MTLQPELSKLPRRHCGDGLQGSILLEGVGTTIFHHQEYKWSRRITDGGIPPQWFSTKGISSPRRHWVLSGDVLVVRTQLEGGPGIQWLGA